MLFTLFGRAFKAITGFDPAAIFIVIFLAVIAAVVIPNFSKVAGFFGYETRAVLKDKLENAQQNVETLSGVNAVNADNVKALGGTIKITEEVVVAKFEEDIKIEKKAEVIQTKKKKKIEDIKTDPTKTPEVQASEISAVQISSIWDSYCAGTTNPSCQANVTQGG